MLQVDEHVLFFFNWVVFNHQDMVGNNTWNTKTYRWSIPPSGGSYGREAFGLLNFAGSSWGTCWSSMLITPWTSQQMALCAVHFCLAVQAIFLQWHGLWYSQYRQQVRTTQVNRGQIVLLLVAVVLFPWKFSQDLLWHWDLGVGFVTYVFHLQTSLSNMLATWMASFCNRGKYSWKETNEFAVVFIT